MKNDQLPTTDHIARYCKPTTIENGQIQASAFLLRSGESLLSVNWMEYFKSNKREDLINEIRKLYKIKFNRVPRNARMAVLNVGDVIDKVYQESLDNRVLGIVHDPSNNDPSHSSIDNMNPDNEFIAELILETILEDHPANS